MFDKMLISLIILGKLILICGSTTIFHPNELYHLIQTETEIP